MVWGIRAGTALLLMGGVWLWTLRGDAILLDIRSVFCF